MKVVTFVVLMFVLMFVLFGVELLIWSFTGWSLIDNLLGLV